METTIKKTVFYGSNYYQLKSIPSNAQLNIFYNPEIKNEEYFIKAIAEYDKLKEDNELLLNALKGLYEFNLGKADYLDILLNHAEAAIQKAETK